MRHSAAVAMLVVLVGCRRHGDIAPSPTTSLPGMEQLGYTMVASDFSHGFVSDAAVVGNTGYFVGMRGLAVVDLSTPGRLPVLGTVSTVPALQFNDVEAHGSTLYVTAGDWKGKVGALKVFDVGQPSKPTPVSSFTFDSAAIGVHVVDRIAYVGAFSNGLEIVDVANAMVPKRLANWRLPNPRAYTHGDDFAHVWWPAVRLPYVYVTYDGAGLHVLDVSNPSSPVLVGSFDKDTADRRADCFFNEIELAGDIAYVALDYCGLLVLDVSKPSAIREVAHVNPWRTTWKNSPGHGVQIELVGTQLFLSTARDGIYVYDVSNPADPKLTHARSGSYFAKKGCAWGLAQTPSLLVTSYTICLPVNDSTGGVEVFAKPGMRQ